MPILHFHHLLGLQRDRWTGDATAHPTFYCFHFAKLLPYAFSSLWGQLNAASLQERFFGYISLSLSHTIIYIFIGNNSYLPSTTPSYASSWKSFRENSNKTKHRNIPINLKFLAYNFVLSWERFWFYLALSSCTYQRTDDPNGSFCHFHLIVHPPPPITSHPLTSC